MDNTAPKPFVFVLMPFSKGYDDIYQVGIKPACKNAGAYAERVDEQLFQESILDRVYNQIAKADIIISDMTGRNPNVFYETGYAHALGKAVILMTQNAEDIPFDLKHYPHIIYKGRITELIPEIEKRVKYLISQPTKKITKEAFVEFYIDGATLTNKPILKYEIKEEYIDRLYLKLDAHNPICNIIQIQRFQIGLDTSIVFNFSEAVLSSYDKKIMNIIKQPNGRYLHFLNETIEIFPGAWDTIYIQIYGRGKESHMPIGHIEPFSVRIFTEKGVTEYPFEMKIEKKL
jgi:hypothetical protein